MSPPLVSVIIATYNSSHLLKYAISSVLLSDFNEWELIVVGDHCTDNTDACVASFGDERIRFINLERNSGQQATPNNIGIRASRGEYVAFLNQDDMYLDNHLSGSLDLIRHTGADIVCSAYAVVQPTRIDKIDEQKIVAHIQGYSPSGCFKPKEFQVASSWLLKRVVTEEVGPWKLENETYVTPSQDWLFRAWRNGKIIRYKDQISLVVIYSGQRKDSYRKKHSPEHDFIFREVVESNALRDQVLASDPEKKSLPLLGQKLVDFYDSILIRHNIHPHTPRKFIRWGGRGGFIRNLKKFTG